MLYHAGISNPDDEQEFLTVADYEKFMQENNLYIEGARKIMITGQMADATDLIKALENAGYNVYPVQSMTRFMSSPADEITMIGTSLTFRISLHQ